MGKFIDLTGWIMKEHGVEDSRLTVLHKDIDTSSRRIKWVCQCECGNIISVNTSHLKSGHTRSCGCIKQPDMTGWIMKEHGVPNSRWTVIEKLPSKDGKGLWKCKCECGTEQAVLTISLRSGKCLSCGCYKHDTQFIDMTGWKMNEHGQPLSKWYIIEYAGKRNERSLWKCKCECGVERIVNAQDLRNGSSLSCGCSVSKGQQKIIQILLKHNIQYQTEKTFETCRLKETNHLAKFDFYINDKYLIEFDGRQHFYYEENTTSWNTKENLKKTQQRDKEKNQWCIDNNIPLIRIPYTHLDDLCLEDLLLETSQFIYKPDKEEI